MLPVSVQYPLPYSIYYNSKSLIQRLPSAFSRLQFSFQLEKKEEKGISRADLCILTPLQFYWCLNRRPAFSFFFSPPPVREFSEIKWLHHEFMSWCSSGWGAWSCGGYKGFLSRHKKDETNDEKRRDGADTEVEEEPESYWRIWETPGFCLWRENRKKPNPEAFYVNSASKKTKPDPNKKTQPPNNSDWNEKVRNAVLIHR